MQTVVDLEGLGSNPGSSSEQLSLFGEISDLPSLNLFSCMQSGVPTSRLFGEVHEIMHVKFFLNYKGLLKH